MDLRLWLEAEPAREWEITKRETTSPILTCSVGTIPSFFTVRACVLGKLDTDVSI